jgi:cell wall-associated NlpC family hydrolase
MGKWFFHSTAPLFKLALALLALPSCALLKKTYVAPEPATSRYFDQAAFMVGAISSSSPSAPSETFVPILDESPIQASFNTGFQGPEYIPNVYFRYAVLLDVEVEKLSNQQLLEYIHQWWGTPYRIGGSTASGIDCSNFVRGLTNSVYGLELPRTSKEQAAFCREISREELREGDLVFFNTGRGISHVGVYLMNDKFVHASTSMGVVISSLQESYWSRRYVKSGRITTAD